ncbi:MAG: hypothetical protein EZS28_002285 [Streblomastix strix]|uniref:t-SNARE coiled-coil homology domain-containing protein n=1 Tax=Streblomastix strix TaxID=222440 RepID=A0A5J4X4S1_9EUKA|nr:MAG: hypothetical protein EZS28_002285 [Streblomastix strix]
MRQVQIIRQQDVQLDVLHEATGQLKQMSVVMGDEIDKQDKAIDGLGEDIDRNKNKIGILNKTIDKVRNTKHKGLWYAKEFESQLQTKQVRRAQEQQRILERFNEMNRAAVMGDLEKAEKMLSQKIERSEQEIDDFIEQRLSNYQQYKNKVINTNSRINKFMIEAETNLSKGIHEIIQQQDSSSPQQPNTFTLRKQIKPNNLTQNQRQLSLMLNQTNANQEKQESEFVEMTRSSMQQLMNSLEQSHQNTTMGDLDKWLGGRQINYEMDKEKLQNMEINASVGEDVAVTQTDVVDTLLEKMVNEKEATWDRWNQLTNAAEIIQVENITNKQKNEKLLQKLQKEKERADQINSKINAIKKGDQQNVTSESGGLLIQLLGEESDTDSDEVEINNAD